MMVSSRPTRAAFYLFSLFACGAALPLPSRAGEWPQVLGLNRDGIAAGDEKLAERWPERGPKVVWRRDEIGSGFAGVAVAGRKLWSRATFKDFGAPTGYFGAGSSPIVVGDKVLVNVGGDRQGAGIVAFSLEKGETLWKATANAASYSSPIAVMLGGEQQVIF